MYVVIFDLSIDLFSYLLTYSSSVDSLILMCHSYRHCDKNFLIFNGDISALYYKMHNIYLVIVACTCNRYNIYAVIHAWTRCQIYPFNIARDRSNTHLQVFIITCNKNKLEHISVVCNTCKTYLITVTFSNYITVNALADILALEAV